MEKVSALIHFHNCFFAMNIFFAKRRESTSKNITSEMSLEENFSFELWAQKMFLPHFRSKEFNITSFCDNVSNIVSLLILGDITTDSY